MEKAIIIICLVLGMSCSQAEDTKTEKKEIPKGKPIASSYSFCKTMPSEGLGTFIPPVTVQWMYLDDSLKNICRALNFRLPYMESDIKNLPEMITPEILGLSPIRTFEIISKERSILSDSMTIYHYLLKKDNCNCDVVRIYKGKVEDSKFDGYEITEQIVCNAKDEIIPNNLSGKNKVQDKNEESDTTNKYEVHGHEH